MTYTYYPETETLDVHSEPSGGLGSNGIQPRLERRLREILSYLTKFEPRTGSEFSFETALSMGEGQSALVIEGAGIILGGQPIRWSGVVLQNHESEKDATHHQKEFSGNVTHAFKAPVNRIAGLNAILLSNPSIDDEARELLTYLDQSTSRLKEMINHLLLSDHLEYYDSPDHWWASIRSGDKKSVPVLEKRTPSNLFDELTLCIGLSTGYRQRDFELVAEQSLKVPFACLRSAHKSNASMMHSRHVAHTVRDFKLDEGMTVVQFMSSDRMNWLLIGAELNATRAANEASVALPVDPSVQ